MTARSIPALAETSLHGRSFHLLKNVRKTTARVLWVSTPPLF